MLTRLPKIQIGSRETGKEPANPNFPLSSWLSGVPINPHLGLIPEPCSPASLPFPPNTISNLIMKSPRLFGIVFLAFCATARADLTVVQKMAGADGVHQITLKVKGDKARVDVTPQVTTIIDAKTGDLTTLINDKKTVMRISGERAKAMAEVAKSFVKEEAPEQALPKPTGQKETISGYETEEYVSDSPKYHATYWVAKSYPNYENILQQMSLLQRGAFASITKGMPDYHALPGLPLRTEIKVPGQGQITSTIESVSLSPLPASEFDVPANYSEEKLPDIIGGKQSPDKSGTP